MIVEAETSSRTLQLARAVLRRRRLVVLVPLTAALVAAVVSLLVPSRYRAITSFVPVGKRMPQLPSALAGLASQLMPGMSGEASQTPGYYVQILQSRELLVSVLGARLSSPTGDSVTLLDVLVPPGKVTDPEKRQDRAIRKLRDAIFTSADNQTSIIQAGVELRDRHQAAEAANAMATALDAFSLRMSRDQARQRRVFVEERRNEIAEELRQAEGRLRSFMLANRVVEGAPELMFEQGRLQRQVQMVQEMYLTLNRAYENMRVEESNDVAAITVIDPAIAPVRRSFPARRVWVVMAFLLALTASLALVATLEWLESAQQRDAVTWADVRQQWETAVTEVRLRRPSQAGTGTP